MSETRPKTWEPAMSAATPTPTDLGPNSQNHHTEKNNKNILSYSMTNLVDSHLHMNFGGLPHTQVRTEMLK